MVVQTILEELFLMLGGIVVFMFGMKMMGSNLEKAAGNNMRNLLGKITNNRLVGVGIGAGVTAIINSSAATTVMLVGFVNIGLMTLKQAAAVIMGANIGTTITAQIVSLQSFNLFDINAIFSLVAAVGFFMSMSKKDGVKRGGLILFGLGMIFIGLRVMSISVNAVMDEVPSVTDIFKKVDNVFLLLLVGIVFTALIQSSSAVTGIVIVFAGSGILSLQMALFITLGSNVGTCITAMLASIGTSTNAKRTAIIHLLFNVIGCLIVFVPLYIWQDAIAVALEKISGSSVERQIANFHTLFNIAVTLILLPFINLLVTLAVKIIPEKKTGAKSKEKQLLFLDDRILETPPIAVAQIKREILNMADISFDNYKLAAEMLINAKTDKIAEIKGTEEVINYFNKELTEYLVKISSLDISDRDEKLLGTYYHVISDIERIGDYAENLMEDAEKMKKDEVAFSEQAREELDGMCAKIDKLYCDTIEIFDTGNTEKMNELNAIEDEIDEAKSVLSEAHIERLNKGQCTPASGAIYLSVASNLERIADHMVNIAYSVKKR